MTIDVNKIQITNTNSINNTIQKVSFRGATDPIPNDTVEISSKKKGMSNTAKWGIGLGTVGALAITAAFVFKKKAPTKSAIEEWKKPILEKLKFTPLKDTLVFKDAKTIEEAREFATKQLNITEVDKDISLDVLNWINKGLVDISNASKGNVKMPKSIKLADLGNETAAGVESYVRNEDFGILYLNKNVFGGKTLDKSLDNLLQMLGKDSLYKNGKTQLKYMNFILKGRPHELIQKYCKKELNFAEKLELYETFGLFSNKLTYSLNTNPMKTFELLAKRNPELKINLEEIAKKEKAAQTQELKTLLESLVKKNKPLNLEINETPSQYRTIYHELGHLQDSVKNTESILSKDPIVENYNWKNRRGTIISVADDMNKGYLKEYPKDFKEFIESVEIQQTAGEVSSYAQTGIGEFIAETYAAMLEGRPLSDKVKALYKKYNGPTLINPPKTNGENARFFKQL